MRSVDLDPLLLAPLSPSEPTAMALSTAYLVLYNGLQTVGWAYMLFEAAPLLLPALTGAVDPVQLFIAVWQSLSIFQTAAVLEILHAAVGLVRSNVAITTFQVFSRVGVLWCVLWYFPEGRSSRGLPLLLFAWGVTEVIRYSFYFCGLLGGVPGVLKWLRYTLFIALYPIGVTGELMCGLACVGPIKQDRPYSLTMPNRWNFTLDSYVLFMLVLLSYVPIFPQLYMHMFGQRRKVLGGGGGAQPQQAGDAKKAR